MLPTPHTLTVYPSIEDTDPDGNPVRRPGPTGITVRGWLQYRRPDEDNRDGQQATARAAVYLVPSAPELDAFSALDFDGHRFALDGPAYPHGDAANVRIYWRADVRRVQ